MKDSCRFTAMSQAAWGHATVVFVPVLFCYDRTVMGGREENIAKTGSQSLSRCKITTHRVPFEEKCVYTVDFSRIGAECAPIKY